MASTQVARAAAQLHEAALDVARVAALRSTQPQEPATGPQVPQQFGLAEDLAEDEDNTVPGEGATTVPEEDRDAHLAVLDGRDDRKDDPT